MEEGGRKGREGRGETKEKMRMEEQVWKEEEGRNGREDEKERKRRKEWKNR